jgi:hypothetical protein
VQQKKKPREAPKEAASQGYRYLQSALTPGGRYFIG